MKTITMLDEVHCKANADARKSIKFALAYKAEHWRQGEWAMEQEVKRQFLITGRKNTGGTFLTGLLPRIKKYCKKRGVKLSIELNQEKIKPVREPILNGIKFREDQLNAIYKGSKKKRGRIIAPTGSGKTIVTYGFISRYTGSGRKFIYIMHTKDLWNQAISEARKYSKYLPPLFTPSGSKNVQIDLEMIRDSDEALMICLIQSLAKINPVHYIDIFDGTLIDECHHVVNPDSQYGKFMQHNLSPIRLGFTATVPTNRRQLLTNEGLLGPTIAKLTMQEGIEKGIIAKPKVKIINVPYNVKINKICSSYTEYYKYGIIENKVRNNEIRKVIEKSYKRKRPVLVIIEKIEHGKQIQKITKSRAGIKIPFVHGGSKPEKRNDYKRKLIDGKLNGIIASRIWMEGINIPNLRTIVYAAGMKEEKKTMQAMGRGLRTTERKKKILLIDFLDPYRYLAEHSVLRLQVYNEQKWL